MSIFKKIIAKDPSSVASIKVAMLDSLNIKYEMNESQSIIFNGKNAKELKDMLSKNNIDFKEQSSGALTVSINGKDVNIFKEDKITVNGKNAKVEKPKVYGSN